jgi:hypothetical protein
MEERIAARDALAAEVTGGEARARWRDGSTATVRSAVVAEVVDAAPLRPLHDAHHRRARSSLRRCRPGHFVEVAVEAPGTLLRRPLSVARAETAPVASAPSSSSSDLRARVRLARGRPVGTRTSTSSARSEAVPAPAAARALPARRWRLRRGTAALPDRGARPARASGRPHRRRLQRVDAAALDRGEAGRAQPADHTDDGSAGMHGRVTDAMPDVVARMAAT